MATLMPDRTWLIDELGELTFREVDRRTNALARGLPGPRGRARATRSR